VSQVSAVVVQNHSPYTLTVTYGPNQYSLSPWTADLYVPATTGVSVNLSATNPTGQPATNPTAIATWYLPGEAPAGNAYPYGMPALSVTSETGDVTAHMVNAGTGNVTVIDGMLSGALNAQAIITNLTANAPLWTNESWTLTAVDNFTGAATVVIAPGAWTATGTGTHVGDRLTGTGTFSATPAGYQLVINGVNTSGFAVFADYDVNASVYR